MINKLIKIVLFSMILLLMTTESKATHMVGGDLSYRCLGNGYFEVTLTIRRDCDFGSPEAFFDNTAFLAIFDQYGGLVLGGGEHNTGLYKLPYTGNDTLQEALYFECGMTGEEVCVHEAIYRDTIYIPRPQDGIIYNLVYQRCCRNKTIQNINVPLETGNEYRVEIDQAAYDKCNESPAFKQWPNIYICQNQPIEFDHSAYESEGDSLVYKLYTPYRGGTFDDPRPTSAPGYTPLDDTIIWSNGYSLSNIMGGSDPLKIDSKTGLLTGTPPTLGQFLVGVLVEEYRDGELLSIVRRDFEYNVRECVEPPVADFDGANSVCGSEETDTLVFTNKSQFADLYEWSIYTHSTGQTFVSTDEDVSIIYTLPTSGKDTFDITLSAYQELANCEDVITRTIYVMRDPLLADFDIIINDCYNDSLNITLNLKDKFDELNPLYTWKSSSWTLGFTNSTLFAEGQIVTIVIPKEDSVTITLDIDTEENCQASYEETIPLIFARLEFIANPLVICKGDPAKIIKNPNSDWTYTWIPETGLDFSDDPINKSDPSFVLDHDITYIVEVTDGICTDRDTVEVKVQDYFDIAIDGPDTVCVDTVELTATGGFLPNDSIIVFEWSNSDEFNNIIAVGKTVSVSLNSGVNTFYLRVKQGTGCSNNIDSITVFNGSILLDYDKEVRYCTNNNARIRLINLYPNTDVTVHWEDNPLIVKGQDSLVLIIYTETTGDYDLIFHAVTEYGCELTDTIHIIASEGPILTLANDIVCDSYTMCFKVTGGILSDYNWDFGDLASNTDISTDAEPCYNYPTPGVYHVAVEVLIESCGGLAYLEKDVIVPEILEISVPIQNDGIYCEGDEVTLIVNKNAESTIEWFNSIGGLLGTGDTLTFNPEGEMVITVIGSDIYDCKDTTTVSLNPYIYDITFVDPGVRCKGDTLELEILNNSGANLTFEWFGDNIISGENTNNPTIVVFEDSDFEVKVTDLDYGCDSVFVVAVDVSEIDVTIDADPIEVVITNSSTITVSDVPPNATIQWSTGESDVESITITPLTVTASPEVRTYCVTVTDEYGCTDVECIDLTIIDPACDETDIYIPNAFSPNGDSNNDIFRVRGNYVRSVDLEIYDRWGELLFKQSGDKNINWDGKFRGKELPPDAYTYRVHVQCEDTDHWENIGNVSIIK